MSTNDPYQFSSYNDTITWSNEDEFELDALSIAENLYNSDSESNSSTPDQSTSQNTSVTVTNSLGKRVRKKKALIYTKQREKSWMWFYFKRSQPDKKIYCQVKVTNDDGNKESCNHDYELTTRTGNLKAHLCQIHRILLPEKSNSNSLTKIVSNQSSLDDFMNKKTPLPSLKQEKIANYILAWIIDDLQPFNATTNNCFRDLILECEPRFKFPCYDQLKEKLMQSISIAKRQLKDLLQTMMDSFCFTTDLWSQAHQPYIAITIY
ncbi:6429_t:CDS:1 [Racocetra fulgida]|uniref:6429_t:CDS:1 n=1 Tax=Racocetra fulgida TaxID=60492 RepID=A0A9N9GYV9_9GLOM|nr:6429_t:CDS:1 [Racocetra fulgida]